MTAAVIVVGLWLLFAGTHMAPSSVRWRPRLVERMGERGFLGLYSAVSFATFVPLVWFYVTHRHAGPVLWTLSLGPIGLWTIYALQAVAWTLVVASVVQPNPASLGMTEARRPHEPHGVQRITRHPMFMGVGLFGLLHLPLLGSASDVAFFAGFPLFAWAGCAHQDRRKRLTQPGYEQWCRETPFLPFAGAGALRGLRELPVWVPVAGVALTVLLRWLHGPLFR
jgi:uncharacterized membrane protein